MMQTLFLFSALSDIVGELAVALPHNSDGIEAWPRYWPPRRRKPLSGGVKPPILHLASHALMPGGCE
jgi:hypothetical protein